MRKALIKRRENTKILTQRYWDGLKRATSPTEETKEATAGNILD